MISRALHISTGLLSVVPLNKSRCRKVVILLLSPAQAFSMTEILTMAIVSALVLVAVVFAVTTCAVRAKSRKMEGHQPLLGDHYQRYDDDKSQSVV